PFVEISEIHRDMRVAVHETGRKGCVADINYLRIRRRAQIAADVDDFITLNNDNAVLRECPRFAIEQMRCFEHDDLFRSLSGVRENREGKDCENKPELEPARGEEFHPRGIEISANESKSAQ